VFVSNHVYARVVPGEDNPPPNSVPGKMLPQIHPGQRILDVGCGGGRFARFFTAREAVVTGIERNPEAAALARAHCARVIEGDLSGDDLLDPKERFDVIVCADVLEHLAYPGDTLSRLVGHLLPGGFVLVSLPNVAHYKVRFGLLVGRFDYTAVGIMDRSHLRFFTRRTAMDLIHECGLQVTHIDAVYSVPLGRLERLCAGMQSAIGRLAPDMFALQWVFRAERAL
jgi:2-polyprenyl-3-methyl-5-hydroxy-6-metoxy-1,4-benzoquinol methylase